MVGLLYVNASNFEAVSLLDSFPCGNQKVWPAYNGKVGGRLAFDYRDRKFGIVAEVGFVFFLDFTPGRLDGLPQCWIHHPVRLPFSLLAIQVVISSVVIFHPESLSHVATTSRLN